jgi:hypothetical protein
MPHETLDYRTVAPPTRQRANRIVSHAGTAAGLCLVAMWFDRALRFDSDEARNLPWIEMGLIIYGFRFAVMGFVHN